MRANQVISQPSARKTVIVYRKELLRVSETFIKAQAQSFKRWRAVLYGERIWPRGMSLDGVDSRTLIDGKPSLVERVLAKARQTMGFAPAGVIRKFKQERADIFHAHFGQDGILAFPYAQKLGVPLVVTLHGHDVNVDKVRYRCGEYGFWQRRYPEQFAILTRQPRVHFIAVSKALREAAIKFGVPDDRVVVRYTGIDVDMFRPGPKPIECRRRQVIFVGRLVEMKGCGYLIEAFQEVMHRVADAELVIIGDGPLRKTLERRAQDFRVRVTFLGELSHDIVKDYLDQSRVLCLPSITGECGAFEAFGMVLLEAQACGVPVVTSSRGGREGVLEGVTGFTFPERDVALLARRLCEILQNEELAVSMSRAAPGHIKQNFNIMACTRRIEDLYESIFPGAN
jgi:glycosyltransferase involved in cell wall biosynthesis